MHKVVIVNTKDRLHQKLDMFTCSGNKEDHLWSDIFPAAENSHSAGVDVAGMPEYLLVTFDKYGKCCSFHCSGLVVFFLSTGISLKYFSFSLCTLTSREKVSDDVLSALISSILSKLLQGFDSEETLLVQNLIS